MSDVDEPEGGDPDREANSAWTPSRPDAEAGDPSERPGRRVRGVLRRPAIAALLNLSGLGAGYLYLHRWVRWVVHAAVMAALVVGAYTNDGHAHPALWVGAIGGWVVLGVADVALAARRAGRRSPPEARAVGAPSVGVALGVVLIAAAAGGFLAYQSKARSEFDSALAAHRAGDCARALRGYRTVTTTYELTFLPQIDRADRNAVECRSFQEASKGAPGDFGGAVRRYRAFLERYPTAILAASTRARIGQAYDRWGDQELKQLDYDGALAKYATATGEFAGTPGAAAAERSIQQLADRAFGDLNTKDGCDARDMIDALIDNDLVVSKAQAARPTALYDCAVSEHRAGQEANAIADLNAFSKKYPDNPLIGKARTLLIDAEVAQFLSGAHDRLDLPFRAGSAVAGRSVIEIENDEPNRIELLFSGPVSKSVVIEACRSCHKYDKAHKPSSCTGTGPDIFISLDPGKYLTVLHAPNDPNIRVAAGTWDLANSQKYFECYFLIS